MHANETWIAMFRRIPEDLHDGLSVGLSSGVEVVIQKILTLDPDFVVLRGRLSGTQEGMKIMCIPYNQLTVAVLARPLKDTEAEAIFGKAAPPAVLEAPLAAVNAPTESPAEKGPDAAASEAAVEVGPAKKSDQPDRTDMLAKLRKRLKDAPPAGK